jgi:hypothetical protein
MSSSGFPAEGGPWSADLAVGYLFEDPMSDVSPPDTIQAAGALESTPLDLARWADAAWGGTVFGDGVAATMSSEPYDLGGGWAYGAGTLVIEHDGGIEHGHNGVWGGFLGWSGHRPDLEASLGILVNGYPSDGAGGVDLGVSTRLAADLWAAVDAAR